MEDGGAADSQQDKEIIKPRPSGKLDAPFTVMLLVLLALGLICLFSASYADGYYNQDGDSTYYVVRQAIFALGGLLAMYFVSRMDYHKWILWSVPLYVFSLLLLATIFVVPSMWKTINHATRWIDFFGLFTIQPTEIVKFALIILFSSAAAILGPKNMRKWYVGIVPFVALIGVTALLIFPEKHFSAIAIVAVIGIVIIFLGGAPWWWLAGAGIAGLGAGAAYVLASKNHVWTRFAVWLDPFSDARGKGWQGSQAQIAVGSGGFWGLGLGQSRQKHLYLPEPANDFIFAVMCEEFGFLITSLIVILFGMFIWRGYYIASHAGDRLGTLLAAGITTHIAVQVIMNMFVVTGIMPITGASLPFFSYGGTSLFMLLVEVGVLLNVSRSMPPAKGD